MATEKRLIDAKQLKTDMYLIAAVCNTEYIFIDAIIDEIDNADDVDAVEVVRCKDCKHFWESFSGSHSCKLHKGLVGTKYDTFCSYGERKDNEQSD